MYKYHHPKPIIVKLTDELGFQLGKRRQDILAQTKTGLAQNAEVQRNKDLAPWQKWLYGTS